MAIYRFVDGRQPTEEVGPDPQDHAPRIPEASTQSTPKSEAWVDGERSAGHPTRGEVVRWTSARTHGLGQVDEINGTKVTIRTWLPARSRSVTVPLSNITRLPALTRALIDAYATSARR